MKQIDLNALVPVNHKYRAVKFRLLPKLQKLGISEDPLIWAVSLQCMEELEDAQLISHLQENLCAKWFCGLSLLDAVPDEACYQAYKQRLSAYHLLIVIRSTLDTENQRLISDRMFDLLLDQTRTAAPADAPESSVCVLALHQSQWQECREVIFAHIKHEQLFSKDTFGIHNEVLIDDEHSQQKIKSLLKALPSLRVGMACGAMAEMNTLLEMAERALQRITVHDAEGLSHTSLQDEPLYIINMTFATKRLMMEEFLKGANKEQSLALFRQLADRLHKKQGQLHWLQSRHELLKLYLSFYNGAMHYRSELPFGGYLGNLRYMLTCSLSDGLERLKQLFDSLHEESYEALISINNTDYVQDAKALIDANYGSDLSLGEVARLYDITPEYLSTIFHRDVGKSFSEYLLEVRMQHACELLSSTRMPVSRIAVLVGYGSADYFGRVFKQQMHLTPRQYQRRMGMTERK